MTMQLFDRMLASPPKSGRLDTADIFFYSQHLSADAARQMLFARSPAGKFTPSHSIAIFTLDITGVNYFDLFRYQLRDPPRDGLTN